MALLASVDSVREDVAIMRLVALAPAQWTHLVASEGLGPHYLLEISNQLNLLQSIWIRTLNLNIEADSNLAHQTLDEVVDVRDQLILNALLQNAAIRLEELHPDVIVRH